MGDEQTQNFQGPPETGDESAVPADPTLPAGLKLGLASLFGLPAALILFLLIRYSLTAEAKPSELGLGTVLIFCLAGLATILIPWDLLGMRLTKIGPLEFKQVINTQKKEQSETVQFLQNQIDEIKKAIETGGGSKTVRSFQEQPSAALPVLLERFFRNYPRRFFSPYTIISWGGRQPAFKELASFKKEEVTQTLLSMLATGQVQTRISRKGNTLYGIRP